MNNDIKKRITILLGAGAIVFPSNCSTQYITETIYKKASEITKHLLDLLDECFVKEGAIYSTPEEEERGYCYSKLNFEDYYHLIEILRGFTTNKCVKNRMNKYQIIAEKKKIFDVFSHLDLIQANKELNDIINNCVYEYSKNFQKNGVLIKELINLFNDKYYLDIFNLNYDTLCEQALIEYNDGFIDSNYCGKFSIEKFNNHENIHTVSHLHGCINYGYIYDPFKKHKNQQFYSDSDTDLHKFENYEDNDIRNPREDDNQAGEALTKSNIITGLLKTDKILEQPFMAYYNHFINCLNNNDAVVIVGYGCGDQYINKCLQSYILNNSFKKFAFIDYIVSKTFCNNDKMAKTSYAKEKILTTHKEFIYEPFWHDINSVGHRYIEKVYVNDSRCIFTQGLQNVLDDENMRKVLNSFINA